ncbi:hypothetical protein OG244_17220 [Streptomyces brevispora]|nr:hypothetical protein [Streptomyces brevispora]
MEDKAVRRNSPPEQPPEQPAGAAPEPPARAPRTDPPQATAYE